MTGALTARAFALSSRLKQGFELLKPPFQIYHRPSPEFSSWLWDVTSYLRFLEALPHPDHSWRFSLVFSKRLNDGETCERLLRLKEGARAVIINLSTQERLEIELTVKARSEHPIERHSISLESATGTVLDIGESRATWQVKGGEESLSR